MVKVSIIATSWNRPQLLRQAVESILAQTEKDWELILMDDCSTMKDVDEVLNWANRDARVRVFRCAQNINNLSILWNKGIDLSTGKYLCLLDDDNKRAPDFLEKMTGFLDANPQYYAVACFAYILQGEKMAGVFDGPARMTRENIKLNNYIDGGCMMWRRELIDEIGWFDERLRSCDDWDYVKRIALQTEYGFGLIREPLSYYRWHDKNRSYTKSSLDDVFNQNFIVYKKNYYPIWSLLLFHQDKNRITLSQNNVLEGVRAALQSISFLRTDCLSLGDFNKKEPDRLYDIVFVFAPFSIDGKAVESISKFGKEVIHFHIEDPQVVGINLGRAKTATYVFTNDISVMDRYDTAGLKVGFCPSVSFDDINLGQEARSKKQEARNKKEYGVVFYGYAYESRKRFVRELESKLRKAGYPLTVIGGGWYNNSSNYLGELSQAYSMKILGKSKIVILKNREKTDLGGDERSIEPQSVVRGYFECGTGALVMLDDSRKHHSFDGEVIFYEDIDDLVGKVDFYMRHPQKIKEVCLKARLRALGDFTYRTRMRKLVNAVRSQRFWMEIS